MEDSFVLPRLDIQHNTLSSQLHADGTEDAIYNPQLPIAETGTPMPSHRTPDPATDAVLLKAYWNTAWFVWGFAWVFTMTLMAYVSLNHSRDETTIQASISHMPYYYAWFFVVYLVITACGGARINRWAVGLLLIGTLPFIGMLILALKRGDDIYDGGHSAVWLTLWRTGILPTSPSVCEQRLEKKQHILLSTDYYSAQFARAVIHNDSGGHPAFVSHTFNETRFLEVHNNADICYQGFEGNPDLYGLGVRLCIYLQWVVALITNNFLPHARQTYRAAWLIFSTGMCIIAFVASIADYCIFGIEIEILYWMYWGGFACVYASAPSPIRLGGQAKGVGFLDWKTAILCTLHISMAYHGVWFSWWGYDQIFARMPCGTYQFIFAKFLDPSTPYCYARDVLSVAFNMIATPLLLVIPVALVIMAVEIKASVQDSAVYHMFFRKVSVSPPVS
ncbi:beta-ketoacyl synthase [Fusarium flagelliforme]|uniref:Beta-ketoacyl synthase n=1 Tax=Fusarium flagelliforme TaxID=2675880 RepID=A0A395MBP0_9HYPO|nr:beta-ketoacyl synthase [Fusarium flagelliforme]